MTYIMDDIGDKAANQAHQDTLEKLESHGLSFDYLLKKLKRELNAKEVKVFNNKEQGIVYSDRLIAWKVRQEARKDAHKLRGDYPAEKQEHSHTFENSMSLAAKIAHEMQGETPKNEDNET